MKQKYLYFLIFFLLLNSYGYSQIQQTHVRFAPNRLATYISNTGVFNQNIEQNNFPGLEWPAGSNKFVWFTSGLTIGAKVNGQLRMAVASYTGEYAPGYILGDSAYTNSDFRHYRINRSESPLGNPDYENYHKMIPFGAPYDDVNNNGVFDIGIDKPGMKGAFETVFICLTDGFIEQHNSSEGFGGGTAPLMAEVRVTFWGNSFPGLENVHFMKFEIVNKSGSAWDSTYFALINDVDLGEATDDYVGCDTILDMGYVYNSDNEDGSGSHVTYGLNPPAAGMKFLKISGQKYNKMRTFCRFNNSSFGQCENDPDSPTEAYRFISGYKNDGSHWINPLTMEPTKYNFPGDPETGSGWTELNGRFDNCGGNPGMIVPNPGGDRRMLFSTGSESLTVNPGDTTTIYAMQLVARGTNHLNSVTELKKKARRAEIIFNAFFAQYLTHTPIAGNPLPAEYQLYQNYPNPFNPATTIKFEIPEFSSGFEANTKLSVFDISGREVITFINEKLEPGTYEYTFDGTHLSSGVYYYKLESGGFIETRKMVLVK